MCRYRPRIARAVRRHITCCFAVVVLGPAVASAQDSTGVISAPAGGAHYWRNFSGGFAASILVHEAAHVTAALALGSHPWLGFDRGRPTVYSGIDAWTYPHKQFWFSSAGLDAQALLDEAVLDVPHRKGSAFERGVLAGGIGTALFYVTIGRSGNVSDVDFIARTHAMTKMQVTLLYGGVAALHTWRISRDGRYANFFARPDANGRIDVGLCVDTRSMR